MEKYVRDLLIPGVLQKACKAFDLEDSTLQLMGDMENFVFSAQSSGERKVLRLTHSSHRRLSQLQTELDFILHFEQQGVDVLKPLTSRESRFVEVFEASESSWFYATCFEMAQGRLVDPSNPREFGEDLFELWGWTLGKLHLHTATFDTSRADRPLWYEDDLLNLELWYPKEAFPVLHHRASELLEELHDFEPPSLLMHADLHQGNFLRHAHGMTVLDFDDTEFHWPEYDFAVILHSVCSTMGNRLPPEALISFMQTFIAAFYRGYSIHGLQGLSLRQRVLPLSLIRDVQLYAFYRKKLDLSRLSSREKELFSAMQTRISEKQSLLPLEVLESLPA